MLSAFCDVAIPLARADARDIGNGFGISLRHGAIAETLDVLRIGLQSRFCTSAFTVAMIQNHVAIPLTYVVRLVVIWRPTFSTRAHMLRMTSRGRTLKARHYQCGAFQECDVPLRICKLKTCHRIMKIKH